MKTIIRLILTAFLVIFAFTSNTYAEDYTKLSLPEGARARIGKGAIEEIAYSPDGTRLAAISDAGIWIYETQTGIELNLLVDHTGSNNRRPPRSTRFTFSPDGKLIASTDGKRKDKTIRLWDTTTGKIIRKLTGHTRYVHSIAFSPDGQTIASGSLDTTIRLWDVATGKTIQQFKIPDNPRANGVAFNPDGQAIAVGNHGNTLHLWDVATGKTIQQFEIPDNPRVKSVVFSPDGQTIAAGGYYNTVHLWNVATGAHIRTLKGDGRATIGGYIV